MNWFQDVPKNISHDQYCSSIELFNEYNLFAKNNNLDTLPKNRNLVDKMKQINLYKYDSQKMINKKKGAFIGFSIINSHDSDSD